MAKAKEIPIIIDTDPGHDDALAILMLEKSNLFKILALTTVAGNGTIQDTTNNARFILDLIGSQTPIYSGAEKPLKKELIKAKVHGEGGLAGAKITKQENLSGNAAEKMIDIIKENPGNITVLTIGPMTNLAEAFMKESALPSMIKEVVIMGGAINVPGNKSRVGEFNIFVDPDAAEVVFNSDVKKVLVPLDACNEIFFTLEEFDKLEGAALYEPIKNMMAPYIKGIQTFEKTAVGALMYDPLAAYYLINPRAYKTVLMDVRVETVSDLTRGMTVADQRTWGEKKYNIDVVISIDRERFAEDFFAILRSRSS